MAIIQRNIMTTNPAGGIQREHSEENPARDDNWICQMGVRRDCTVPGEAKRRVARGWVCKCNWSCISGVRVVQPQPELCLQDQS